MNDSHNDNKLPLVAHLLELRNRLLYCLACIALVFLGLYYFSGEIYALMSEPLRKFIPEGSTMIATEVASPFLAPFKLTLIASVFVSVPFLLYQLWRFVAPGLYQNEKRLALPLISSSIVLFYSGMAFAYFVVFPLVFAFFTQVAPEGVTVMTDISRYLDFIIKLLFAFGIAFEIPIATLILVATGATTRASLSAKRPYVFIGCFVIGMLLTPPDVISQVLLAIPMWLLFELGIFFSRFVEKSQDLDQPHDQDPAPKT